MIRKPSPPVFPPVPQIVKEWNARGRALQRERKRLVLDAWHSAENGYEFVAMTMDLDLPTLGPVPAEVKQAYQQYVKAYNAEVARYNAEVAAYNREVQAMRNAREVAKIRNARCPHCFSTHAGEC